MEAGIAKLSDELIRVEAELNKVLEKVNREEQMQKDRVDENIDTKVWIVMVYGNPTCVTFGTKCTTVGFDI